MSLHRAHSQKSMKIALFFEKVILRRYPSHVIYFLSSILFLMGSKRSRTTTNDKNALVVNYSIFRDLSTMHLFNVQWTKWMALLVWLLFVSDENEIKNAIQSECLTPILNIIFEWNEIVRIEKWCVSVYFFSSFFHFFRFLSQTKWLPLNFVCDFLFVSAKAKCV